MNILYKLLKIFINNNGYAIEIYALRYFVKFMIICFVYSIRVCRQVI
jgi:hypothetical protein